MEGIATAITPATAPLPLDAGSIFVLVATLLVFCGPLFVLFPPFPPSKSDALGETHTKLGLDPVQSNLTRRPGEEEDHAASPPPPPSSAGASIKSLFIYPVKSCKGIELARAKVLPTGLAYDRLFTFAQLQSPSLPGSTPPSTTTAAAEPQPAWEAITPRQFPLLATIEVELWQPDLAKMRRFRDPAAGASPAAYLLLRFPAAPLHRRPWWRAAGALLAAKCARGLRARPVAEVLLPADADADAADVPAELARYLGVRARLALFRADPDAPGGAAGYQSVVGFADSPQHPVHMMNLASVRDRESKVAKDEDRDVLSPRRFRANIFISGSPAHDEDDWKKIRFRPAAAGTPDEDQAAFHVSCRTTRCTLPSTNQDTGVRHPVEPDRTLHTLRAIDEGAPRTGCLGVQMTPLFEDNGSQHFYLEVGMSAEVLERGEHMTENE